MLSRLSSTLPRRATAPCLRTLPSSTRCNSSAAPEATSDSQAPPAEPRKRSIPLAQSLGDISIMRRQGPRGQNQNQSRWPPRQAGDGSQQQQRKNFTPRPRDPNQANAGPRGEQRHSQRTDQRREPRGEQQARHPRSARTGDQQRLTEQEAQTEREAERAKPEFTPSLAKVELGNLEELFGAPVVQSSHMPQKVPALDGSKVVTPSAARIQLFLENTAGDYSRYVAKPYPTTDVLKLGPVGLGEFVLSRRRGVGLKSRQSALAVVENFAGAAKAKGAHAAAS